MKRKSGADRKEKVKRIINHVEMGHTASQIAGYLGISRNYVQTTQSIYRAIIEILDNKTSAAKLLQAQEMRHQDELNGLRSELKRVKGNHYNHLKKIVEVCEG